MNREGISSAGGGPRLSERLKAERIQERLKAERTQEPLKAEELTPGGPAS